MVDTYGGLVHMVAGLLREGCSKVDDRCLHGAFHRESHSYAGVAKRRTVQQLRHRQAILWPSTSTHMHWFLPEETFRRLCRVYFL
jgi:hypothetical protein